MLRYLDCPLQSPMSCLYDVMITICGSAQTFQNMNVRVQFCLSGFCIFNSEHKYAKYSHLLTIDSH